MLDEPDSQSQSVETDLPTPPRGRRSASRPAGPPKPVSDTDGDFGAELQARIQEQLGPGPAAGAPDHSPESPSERDEEPTRPARKRPSSKRGISQQAGDTDPPARRTRSRRTTEDSPADESAGEGDTGGTDTPSFEEPVLSDLETAGNAAIEGADQSDPATTGLAASNDGSTEGADSLEPNAVTAAIEQATEAASRNPASASAGDISAGDKEATIDEPVAGDGVEIRDNQKPDSKDGNAQDAADEEEPTPAERSGQDADDDDDSGDDDSDDEESSDNDDAAETGSRRRRRRRGGRRRRRGGSTDESGNESTDSSDDQDGPEDSEDSGDGDGSSGESTDDDSSNSEDNGNGEGRRRRRRRRRRGEDTSGADDPDTDVIVKVREPRRGRSSDEVTGIEGSTRMEAKRQRRREGRTAGRRRTPILSEAEFLARREAVTRTMVIRQTEDLAQIAVLEDNVLVEHYVDRASATSLIGNVYLGRIQNVLPSMEAAFVDIGRGRNAVLYAGEVDWDSFGAEGQQRKVEKFLKSGQTILVQVTKDPVGAKGARLTNHISLPGRYIVYSPGGHLSGISRKLSDTERKRLKEILGELVGEDASVIVRTAAEGASEDELVRDVNRLKAQWEIIEKKVKENKAPQQLYAEPDPTVRIVRDLFTEDFGKLIIDGDGTVTDAYDTVMAYVGHVAPHLAERIERWNGEDGDVFAAHRIDEQIAKALERKVYLPSGGSLVIDRTEAMTVIDVNTGKFTGSGGNLEATVTSNNLEAAEEVVRQLRLRDIGGIIVIDFIDMVLPANRELLLRRLVECLGRDRTRHQVAEVTSLGLVQMTRKRIGTGLAEAFTETCEHCQGRGYEIHEVPVESQSQADGGERRRGRGGRGANGRGGSGRTSARGGGRGEGGRDAEEADESTASKTETT